jgi:hypothetical protein
VEKTIRRAWRWLSAHRFEFVLFCLYTLVTIIVAFPVALKMSSRMYGLPGDSFGTVWFFWWQKYAWLKGLDVTHINMIGAPFGVDWSSVPKEPAIFYPAFILTLWTNELFTYNFLLLLSFPVAGITMYALAKHITDDKVSSAVAGFIFAFAPYHFAQSLNHLGMTMSFALLPLVILAIFRLYEKPSVIRALTFGVAFAILALTNFYDAFFILVPLGVFIVYVLVRSFKRDILTWFKENASFLGFLLIAAFVGTVLVMPFLANVLKSSSANPSMYAHNFDELIVWSARPWEYFMPAITNPIFGKLTSSFLKTHGHLSNQFEQTIYLGFIPMVLAFVAVVVYSFRRKKPMGKVLGFATTFFLLAGIASAIASAPPYIPIAGIKIPLFSYFAFKILPMFRIYARFGALVMLCTAALAGLGLHYVLGILSKKWMKFAAVSTIVILATVEFINLPPYIFTDLAKTPSEYTWLKNETGDKIIVEYPLISTVYAGHYDYLLNQTKHNKRLVNGGMPGTKSEIFRQEVANIEDPKTPAVLRRLGVKYAFVHWDRYEDKKPSRVAKGLQLLKTYDDETSVYSVSAEPATIIVFPSKGFGDAEPQSNGTLWRWTADKAELEIDNYAGKILNVSISFQAISFAKARSLEIVQAGEIVGHFSVPIMTKEFEISSLTLEPGRNVLNLTATPKAQSIDSILRNGDQRAVAIMYSSFKVIEKQQ